MFFVFNSKIFIMKSTFFCLLFLFITGAIYAQHQIEKIWESDTTLAVPESVLPGKDVLYVSLIDGAPWEADGKGGIAKLDKRGKIVDATWVTGLHAPKGMGLYDNKLYVADMTDVVVINTVTGKIEKRIPVPGAQRLNDITVDDKGVVYVSDSQAGIVSQIRKEKVTTYLTGFKGLNGLKAVDKDLYIITGKDVYKAGSNKKLSTIGIMELGGDGIEPVGNGDFITSTWSGMVYYLNADGKLETLLDTREQKRNTADIGYDPANRIIYVPTFNSKSVVAYRLK